MIKIANLSDIPPGGSKLVFLTKHPLHYLISISIHAWDNRCPHRGASLSDGYISEKTIQCKYHLWKFSIRKKCAVENDQIKITSFSRGS